MGTLKPYFAQLLQVIRAHSQNIVLATGNEWAYDLQGIRKDPLPGANIAYCGTFTPVPMTTTKSNGPSTSMTSRPSPP